MRVIHLTVVCVAALIATALIATAGEVRAGVITFATSPGGTDYLYKDESIGTRFQVGPDAIVVTALGIWDDSGDGLTNSYDVGIFDMSENLLVSDTVSSGSSSRIEDGTRWTDLASSITLAANTKYVVAAYRPDLSDPFAHVNASEVTIASEIDSLGGVWYVKGSSLDYPRFAESKDAVVGPNFQFTSQAVPEPSSFVLIGVGFLASGLYRWRQSMGRQGRASA